MKKAILIVSFGTTYTETRIKNITAIKNQVSPGKTGNRCSDRSNWLQHLHPNSNVYRNSSYYRHHLS